MIRPRGPVLHDPGFARRRRELDAYAIRLVRDYLLERSRLADRSQRAKRIEVAVWVCCTAMIAAVQPPHRFADIIGLSRDEIAGEIHAMVSSYLGLSSAPASELRL